MKDETDDPEEDIDIEEEEYTRQEDWVFVTPNPHNGANARTISFIFGLTNIFVVLEERDIEEYGREWS